MLRSAFPIVAANAGQVLDRGLTAREMLAAVALGGVMANSQEHCSVDECEAHVDWALMLADRILAHA